MVWLLLEIENDIALRDLRGIVFLCLTHSV